MNGASVKDRRGFMNRKPWPIVIVSLIFFIVPVMNIIGTYFLLDMNVPFFSGYLESLFFLPENRWPLMQMVLPSFVAGIAVYSVKKWSYPVFYLAMAWITFEIFHNQSKGMDTLSTIQTVVLPMSFNMAYCLYFMLPSVRAIYYNPRLRWWETKPRYMYSMTVRVIVNGMIEDAQMDNISEGGILAKLPMTLDQYSTLNIHMMLDGTDIHTKAKVAYRRDDGVFHGLQFVDMTKEQKKYMAKFIRKLEADKCELTRPVMSWEKDFGQWFVRLVKTGKGLVPG